MTFSSAPLVRRAGEWLLAAALGIGGTLWCVGDPTVSRPEVAPAPDSTPEPRFAEGETTDASRHDLPVPRATTVRCQRDSSDEQLRDAEELDARTRTHDLLGGLEANAQVFERNSPQETTEGIVNRLSEYVRGMSDVMQSASPEMISAFSEHIEARFCGESAATSPAVRMIYLRMLRRTPELGSARVFDCFFDAHTQEDVVLWEGIDALKQTDLPLPPAVAQLAQSSKDPRTLIRLVPREQTDALRADLPPPPESRMSSTLPTPPSVQGPP